MDGGTERVLRRRLNLHPGTGWPEIDKTLTMRRVECNTKIVTAVDPTIVYRARVHLADSIPLGSATVHCQERATAGQSPKRIPGFHLRRADRDRPTAILVLSVIRARTDIAISRVSRDAGGETQYCEEVQIIVGSQPRWSVHELVLEMPDKG